VSFLDAFLEFLRNKDDTITAMLPFLITGIFSQPLQALLHDQRFCHQVFTSPRSRIHFVGSHGLLSSHLPAISSFSSVNQRKFFRGLHFGVIFSLCKIDAMKFLKVIKFAVCGILLPASLLILHIRVYRSKYSHSKAREKLAVKSGNYLAKNVF
jgi:ABC-type siderophore export system fused ATPase/permease subunit